MKILATIVVLLVVVYALAQIFFPQAILLAKCTIGAADSCREYGVYLFEKRDYKAAKKPLEKACEAGSENSCAIVEDLYYDDENRYNTAKNIRKAAQLYSKSCNLGGGKACYNAAMIIKTQIRKVWLSFLPNHAIWG